MNNIVRLISSMFSSPVVFIALAVVSPAFVSAAPPPLLSKRQNQGNNPNGNGSSNGSISMTVWLPIILVTVVFVLFSFLACIRRCAAADSTSGTAANRSTSTAPNATRPYRRPRRTPSQISTKSLPAYMKEPGDQELVLFRGPAEMSMDDDMPPSLPMPILAEEDMPEMRAATFDIALGPTESVDTMPDSSTTNLMRRMSVPRPPELRHATMPSDDRQSGDTHSMDSTGSDAELLVTRQQRITAEVVRGDAPSYTEAISAERNLPTLSLDDPEPSVPSTSITVPPTAVRRSRFSFLKQNPFGSHNHTHDGDPSNVNQSSSGTRSASPAAHVRSGTALSRFSTRESHDSHHSRSSSRNNNAHSRSNSNLLRGFRPHSPGLHPGSSTISLDSISSPLTHTLTRAEFHAPKGGLTPEQIKLITSREALERFGVPYGPDAVAAFSLPRETGPPPTFDSVEQSGSGGSATGTVQPSEGVNSALPRSTSPSPSMSFSDERAGSRNSTLVSYTTVPDGDTFQGQTVYMYRPEVEDDEPSTARPITPSPARPLSGP